MISGETIAALEARKLLYILGSRERMDKWCAGWRSPIGRLSCR